VGVFKAGEGNTLSCTNFVLWEGILMKYFRWLNNFFVFIFTCGVLLLGQVESAHALMVNLELKDLVAGADNIISGTVIERGSRWDEERAGITTTVVISVEENIKGVLDQGRIAIIVPGGEVDGVGELVSDTPSFAIGEQVVVFINPVAGEGFEVYGGYQGKFTIKSGNVGKWPLSEFKTRIIRILQGQPLPDIAEQKAYTDGGPAITGIDPGSASAGTNSYISINGSGFGSEQGQVFFFFCSGQPDIEGGILSWSDTKIVVAVPIADINNYPASAGSGPVYVRTSGGLESNEYPFEVTFSYGDVKWPGDDPVIQYKVNPNTADCTGEETAVQNAANTWNAVPNKLFTFWYAGATSATRSQNNSSNEIMWRNLGSGSILASTTYWYIDKTIIEVDMVFNNYYNWSVSGSSGSGQFDIQSVALHEFGHWLNLRDLYGDVSGYPQDTDKVMYGISTAGAVKRTLQASDQSGMRWIYPNPNITTPGIHTDEATNVLGTSATLNGEITSTGGENCDQVKFQYRAQADSEWTDAGVLNGSYDQGIFNFELTGLDPGVNYEYKAMAHNLAGWGEGDIINFTTAPEIYFETGITGSFTWQVTPESTEIPQADVSLWTEGADRTTATPLLTQKVDVTQEGTFQLTNLQPGNYDVTFKLPYSLRAVDADVAVNQDAVTSVNFGEIILGDTWGDSGPDTDNVIDVSDYSAILYSFGSVPEDDKYIDTCDLNRDGVVDVSDYSIVLYNFSKYGEAPY
jgi:hypothetical protein